MRGIPRIRPRTHEHPCLFARADARGCAFAFPVRPSNEGALYSDIPIKYTLFEKVQEFRASKEQIRAVPQTGTAEEARSANGGSQENLRGVRASRATDGRPDACGKRLQNCKGIAPPSTRSTAKTGGCARMDMFAPETFRRGVRLCARSSSGGRTPRGVADLRAASEAGARQSSACRRSTSSASFSSTRFL